jgi:nucleoredoxin
LISQARIAASLGVRGIPMLVFVDGAGNIITREGRKLIEDDPRAGGFPWTPKPFADILGHSFMDNRGKSYTQGDFLGKHVAIYFSAHWCTPCRKFTPSLVRLYNELNAAGKELEVILVSSDRDDESFKFYFNNMPWLTLGAFGSADVSRRQDELTDYFHIKSIPSLIMLDPELQVVNLEARRAIEADPQGLSFPWFPKTFEPLDENSIASINQMPFLLALTDGSPALIGQAIAAITPAASAEKAKLKAKLRFFYLEDPEEEVFHTINKAARLPDGLALVILDIAFSKFYVAPVQDLTSANVSKFVARYLRGTLPSRSFRRQSMHSSK